MGAFKTWLVREAQIRDKGCVTGGRYKGYVSERLGRGLRQPLFAAHPHICMYIYIHRAREIEYVCTFPDLISPSELRGPVLESATWGAGLLETAWLDPGRSSYLQFSCGRCPCHEMKMIFYKPILQVFIRTLAIL